MAISLSKGGNISLSKEDPKLNHLLIGLGWDARSTDGQAFDLDASCYMLSATGKVRSDADFIFFNQKNSACGSVNHMGDNTTGAGDGDDEVIEVIFDKVPADIVKMAICVTIHDFEARKQNFGMVKNASIRCANKESGKEIARYDLSEDASTETAMIFGEIYRDNAGGWKFKAVGQGFNGGLRPLAASFGVNV